MYVRLHVLKVHLRSCDDRGPKPVIVSPWGNCHTFRGQRLHVRGAKGHTFQAAKPARSEPEDRTPDNKRQANYSRKLETLKAAIRKGTIAPGEGITVGAVERIAGGNRETIAALRRDVAAAGLGHWKGKRLVAGAG